MKNYDKFVIEFRDHFVGHDSSSGGYPYWTDALRNTTFYPSVEEAKEELESSMFSRQVMMNDGSVLLPHMVQSGLNISDVGGSTELVIAKIGLTPVYSRDISGSLKEQGQVQTFVTKEEEEILKSLREGRTKVIHV